MDSNAIKYSDLVAPDSSITTLIQQLDQLSDSYMNTYKNIKSNAIQVTAALKGVSGATEAGRKATQAAATDADKLAKAQRDLAFAQSENAAKLAELKQAQHEASTIAKLVSKANAAAEGSYQKLSAQYSLNKIYINKMSVAEREQAEATEGLITRTRQMYEEMKRLQEETGKHQLNVGNYKEAGDAVAAYGERLKASLGLNSQFGESLLALGRGGAEGKAAMTALADGTKALGASLLGLLSNPVFLAIAGIAGAGAAVKWWYDYNVGLQDATRYTHEFLGLSGDGLVAMRDNIRATAETYGKDFMDVLSTVDNLVSQYHIDSAAALDVVNQGFASGADLSGDMLDKMQKYSPVFHDIGLSADQMVAVIQQTRSGIFSDGGLDLITMAGKKIREMSATTAKSLDAIGISSKQMQADLESGNISMFDAIKQISQRLAELPKNSQAVGEVMKDVFGRQAVQGGEQLIFELGKMTTSLEEVKKQTGEWGELSDKQRKATLELNSAVSALFDVTDQGFEETIMSAKIMATQWLVALVKGVIDLCNWVIDLYNNSSFVRRAWALLVADWRSGVRVVTILFNTLIERFKAMGHILKGILTLNWDEFVLGVKQSQKATENLIRKTIASAKKSWKEGFKDVSKEKIAPIKVPVIADVKGDASAKALAPATTQKTSTATAKGKSGKSGKKTDAAKALEQAYKSEISIRRKYEDEQLKLIQDDYTKQRTAIQYQYGRQIEDLQHSLDTQKNYTIEQRRTINATIIALQAEQAQALEKLDQEQQIKALEHTKETIALRLQAVKEGSEQEYQLKLEQIANEEKLELLKNKQKPTDEQQGEKDIKAKYDAQIGKLTDAQLQSQLAVFDQEQKLKQSEFDLLVTTEGEKTRFRLQAEKERLQKVLELNKIAGKKLSDVEVQTIQNTIAHIDQEITESTKQDAKPKDIYDVFGLTLDDDKKDAINSAMSFATDALNQYMDAYVEAANRKVEIANQQVEQAQNNVQTEIAARNAGYANNVALAQKELDNAKKNQEKALKEQQKAQKQQQAIQALEQVGNLVTASALIWKQLGFPWAIPAIATMWGSFALAKVKAMQLTKSNTQTYGDGTVELLQGGSHQSGNDIEFGTKPDGTKRRAEGGEFFAVINKRNSRRFRKYIPDVIHSLNNGTFANKYLNAYNENNGITLTMGGNTPDIKELSDDVREIRKQNEKRSYLDADGSTIISYKNVQRRIRR